MMGRNEIERKADEFTGIYSELPIPVCEIARDQGLKVYKISFGDDANDLSGFLGFKKREIWLNKDDTDVRQFFVTAHELGHWILHRQKYEEGPEEIAFCLRQGADARHDIDESEEKEAEYFAASLVMPQRLVKKLRGNYAPSELATMFNVSRTTMEKRLKGVL